MEGIALLEKWTGGHERGDCLLRPGPVTSAWSPNGAWRHPAEGESGLMKREWGGCDYAGDGERSLGENVVADSRLDYDGAVEYWFRCLCHHRMLLRAKLKVVTA